jgi:hypothetical protein
MIVMIHEGFHYGLARIFNRNPQIKINKYLQVSVVYKNNHNDLQNLVIACVGPLCLVCIGIFISGNNLFSLPAKIFCLANLINLFPVTADGEVIILSLLRMCKHEP